jgi:hypothetical protein
LLAQQKHYEEAARSLTAKPARKQSA